MHPALKAHGLTEAQARVLAKLKAGREAGGMAGRVLLKKGFVSARYASWGGGGVVRYQVYGYDLTPAGEAALAAIRKAGW